MSSIRNTWLPETRHIIQYNILCIKCDLGPIVWHTTPVVQVDFRSVSENRIGAFADKNENIQRSRVLHSQSITRQIWAGNTRHTPTTVVGRFSGHSKIIIVRKSAQLTWNENDSDNNNNNNYNKNDQRRRSDLYYYYVCRDRRRPARSASSVLMNYTRYTHRKDIIPTYYNMIMIIIFILLSAIIFRRRVYTIGVIKNRIVVVVFLAEIL